MKKFFPHVFPYVIVCVYLYEIGQRFGFSHWADRSDAECICSGICFILLALAVKD